MKQNQLCAITLVETAGDLRSAILLLQGLRLFGGRLSQTPAWIFYPPQRPLPDLAGAFSGLEPIDFIPLALDATAPGSQYPFASKVHACAQAEALAGTRLRSLAWFNPGCLIVNPSLLFDLDPAFDAAFRPVHHTNIGSPAQAPLDDYWRAVYHSAGLDEAPFTVESFADARVLRPYFNTHCFAVNPALGLFAAWWEHFQALVMQTAFQSGPCRQPLPRIFLHQAILSALVAKRLDRERLRLLPPAYSYPLHLHPLVPTGRRPRRLNDLVCPVYEDAFEYPGSLNGLQTNEPLRSWLAEHSG
jgi:hypothetical protein